MVVYALPGIFVMGSLVCLMESYVIRCPEQSEWNIRAGIQCQNKTDYFCLYNYIYYTFEEGCTGPEWDIPGSKRVYSGNFNTAPCRDTRYQPVIFVTNGNSYCIFRKSLCTEEGQTLFTNGTTRTDSTCRCDYTHGYAYVTVPRNKCYCRPSEEDCSCYLKKCKGVGYNLSADYECTNDITKKTDCPLISANASEDQHIDMAPTGTLREDNSYVIRRDVFFVVLFCIVGMIVITTCFMFLQILLRCPHQCTKEVHIHPMPKAEVQMEESTQKEHVEERLDYNPMTFSGKYGAESGRISPDEQTERFLTLCKTIWDNITEHELHHIKQYLKMMDKPKFAKARLEKVRNGVDLLSLLQERDLYGINELSFIKTLLEHMNRNDLLREVNNYEEGSVKVIDAKPKRPKSDPTYAPSDSTCEIRDIQQSMKLLNLVIKQSVQHQTTVSNTKEKLKENIEEQREIINCKEGKLTRIDLEKKQKQENERKCRDEEEQIEAKIIQLKKEKRAKSELGRSLREDIDRMTQEQLEVQYLMSESTFKKNELSKRYTGEC